MMSDEADELIARVAESLKPLPKVDANAKALVLVAVAAERERERARRGTGTRWWRATAGVLAAAMVISVVWIRAARSPQPVLPEGDGASEPARGGAPAALAAHGAADAAAALPVQLVFRAPAATHVSVVGDFTGWDAGAAAMTRDPASGLWNVTLAVRPGRHVYAFLVDDSIWVRDPRAPIAPDADFQRPGSLLLVGRP